MTLAQKLKLVEDFYEWSSIEGMPRTILNFVAYIDELGALKLESPHSVKIETIEKTNDLSPID